MNLVRSLSSLPQNAMRMVHFAPRIHSAAVTTVPLGGGPAMHAPETELTIKNYV